MHEHVAKRAKIQQEAGENLKKQADYMIEHSKHLFNIIEKGENMSVPILSYDRAPADLPNVIGIVMDKVHE